MLVAKRGLSIKKEKLVELKNVKNEWNELQKTLVKLGKKMNSVIDYTNAKVYDVSYYTYEQAMIDFPVLTSEEIENEFNNFCDIEWYDFKSEFIENKKLTLDYIGRTSTFRIVSDRIASEFDTKIREEQDYDTQLLDIAKDYETDLSEYLKNNNPYYSYNIDDYIENMYAMFDEMEDIIESVQADFEDIKMAYNALETFKKYQVENFKYYLENATEDVECSEPYRRKDVEKIRYQSEENGKYKSILIHADIKLINAYKKENSLTNDYAKIKNFYEWLLNQDTELYYNIEEIIEYKNNNYHL